MYPTVAFYFFAEGFILAFREAEKAHRAWLQDKLDGLDSDADRVRDIVEMYLSATREMRDRVASNMIDYDMYAIATGIFLQFMVCFFNTTLTIFINQHNLRIV